MSRQAALGQQKVVIIDTGCANTQSLKYAIERLDAPVIVSHEADVILSADKLFLPGVGAVKEAVKNLKERRLVEVVQQVEQPLLGICLGMQLLVSTSEEGCDTNDEPTHCLGLCDAPVKQLQTKGQPLPHMGWNRVTPVENHPLFKGIPAGSHFYFVHSYAVPASVGDYTIAHCEYGQTFTAALQHNQYYGVQFHPERSGQAGSQLIKNFLELTP